MLESAAQNAAGTKFVTLRSARETLESIGFEDVHVTILEELGKRNRAQDTLSTGKEHMFQYLLVGYKPKTEATA